MLPTVKLTVGLKFEDEPYAGPQFMPSARLGWKVTDNVLLWTAVSRALRSPTPIDVSLREYAGPLDVLNGSSNFRPETLTAYEFGTRVQVTPRASFSISGYFDVYDNLRSIDLSSTPGVDLSVRQPDGGQCLRGGGLGHFQVTDWWRLSAGFDLLHEDLRFLPGSTSVAGLAFVADDPGHRPRCDSSMDLGHGVTWDLSLRDVGRLPHPVVDEYVEMNTRIAWDITKAVQVSLSGFNLLHARHVEFIEPGATTTFRAACSPSWRLRF